MCLRLNGGSDISSSGRLREEIPLPLTGEVCAMMTSEINTTRSHYWAGSTEPTNQITEIYGHAHRSTTEKIKTFLQQNLIVCLFVLISYTGHFKNVVLFFFHSMSYRQVGSKHSKYIFSSLFFSVFQWDPFANLHMRSLWDPWGLICKL